MTEYAPLHLVKISADTNNNKYYDMIPAGAAWTASFGRVGAAPQKRSYPYSQWNAKYHEKLRKGYVDRTCLVQDLIAAPPSPGDGYAPIADAEIAEIVALLRGMASRAVAENYTVAANQVTAAMVEEAQSVLTQLVSLDDLNAFNRALAELYGVIPRKMQSVRDHLAKDRSEFGGIIRREQDLLDVMRGQIYVPKPVASEEAPPGGQTILEASGLVFRHATEEDLLKIKSALGSCAGQFKRAWRVSNLRTQAAFDDCVTQGSIATKLLWHGSRNENWWSILNAGLALKPTSAVITGKMFGYGIYFASKARKALGYTSLSGSYWARGSAKHAFMGLYEVAYGKPYDVYSFSPQFDSFNWHALQSACPGASCLHAHEGSMLRNDEIIVYRECQTTVKYLVELGA